MPDVVLPVLNEADALPVGLSRTAGGIPSHRRRQRVERRLGASRALAYGATWSASPPPRVRRRLLGRAGGGDRRDRVLHGCRRLPRPRRSRPCVRPVASGASDLVLGARAPSPSGLADPCSRRQRRAGAGDASADRRGPDRPGPDARRPPSRASRGWASRTVALAGPSRWCCAPPRPTGGSPRYLSRTSHAWVVGRRSPAVCGERCAPSATCGGSSQRARDGHGQGTAARSGQDPPVPAVHARRCGADRRRRVLDTLEAVSRCGADRRILALEGPPGPWLPPGFEVLPQRGTGFDERLAERVGRRRRVGIQIGMDTPQVTPALLDHARRHTRRRGGGRGAGLRPRRRLVGHRSRCDRTPGIPGRTHEPRGHVRTTAAATRRPRPSRRRATSTARRRSHRRRPSSCGRGPRVRASRWRWRVTPEGRRASAPAAA